MKEIECKNCIRYHFCQEGYDNVNVRQSCKNYEHFIDKTKVVILPCDVGDTVYVVNPNYQQLRIRKYEVQSIEIYKNSLMCIRFGRTVSYFSDDIGKTVFLSLEEAEKRLTELKNG